MAVKAHIVCNVFSTFCIMQVAFVATRGASFRSDVAIDDVMLYTCPGIINCPISSDQQISRDLVFYLRDLVIGNSGSLTFLITEFYCSLALLELPTTQQQKKKQKKQYFLFYR